MPKAESTRIAVLVVASLLVLFIGLGSVPLFDKDEGAFCEATREMLGSGNYLMTYLNGEPRYDKPILIYWLQALSAAVFGINEFAMRLPSALAGAGWIAAFYFFARRHYDEKKGFFAAFFLVTAVQVSIIMKAAIADSLLNLFIALTMFDLWRFYDTEKRAAIYRSYAFMALGFLTKGPIAILVPLVTGFLYSLSKRDLSRWKKGAFNWQGIVLFVVIAAPWYTAAVIDQGWPILYSWVGVHTLGRLASPMEGHSGGFLYYVPVLLVGVLPYTTLLIMTLRQGRKLFAGNLERFCLIWFAFVFIFFSFSGTKLPHYVIYGYTPLFLLFTLQLERMKRTATLALPPILVLSVLIFLPEIGRAALPKVGDPFAADIIRDTLPELGWAYRLPLILALAVLFGFWLAPRIPKDWRIIGVGLATVLVVNWHVMPVAGRMLQEPLRDAALFAKERGHDVVLWKLNMPSFMFYQEKLTEERLPLEGEIVVTKAHYLQRFGGYELLYKKKGIALARITKLLPDADEAGDSNATN